MAKPKVDTLITELPISGAIDVYTDEPQKKLQSINSIKGVRSVHYIKSMSLITVFADPRYDIWEVAQKIRDLLTAKVPDVFKEEELQEKE